ncbi:MAG: TetR/AcrR family transcriptional regulator, partial [Solirubrobacterales bacterium]
MGVPFVARGSLFAGGERYRTSARFVRVGRIATADTTRRRTQEERSAETRGRLLRATIDCLLEVGYAGTTTRLVTERAGVSQGAQTHHFPHRVDLVASAFEHLAQQRTERYRERARDLPPDRAARLRALLDLLWEDFSSPLFTVAAKLWVAAADDEELRERLVPVERRINAGVTELARDVAGELGGEEGFQRRLAVAMNTVAGLA